MSMQVPFKKACCSILWYFPSGLSALLFEWVDKRPTASAGACKPGHCSWLLTKLAASCLAALEKSSSQLFRLPPVIGRIAMWLWSLSVVLIDPVMWTCLVIQDYFNSPFPFLFPLSPHGNTDSPEPPSWKLHQWVLSRCLQISLCIAAFHIQAHKCLLLNIRLVQGGRNCHSSLDIRSSLQLWPLWRGDPVWACIMLLAKF